MIKIFIFFLLFLLPLVGWSQPACNNLRITLVPPNYVTNTASTLTFSIQVQSETASGGCSYFIAVDYGSSASFSTRSVKYGSYTWPYQVAKNASGTQVLKTATQASGCSELICDSFSTAPGQQTRTHTYQFILDTSNEWLKYGSYSDNYTLRLYKGTPDGGYTQSDQATMNVTFQAPKKTDLSLVDSGGSFNILDTAQTMNFGSMSAGLQRTADLILKHNAGFTLYASSQNNGSMKHLLANQFVTYTMTLNGATINLAGSSGSPQIILSGSGVSPASGAVKPIVVTLGSTTGKTPGSYEDTITFTIQSNE